MAATGLEGVVAFETEIAEPDRDGNALRYRGVDIEELVGRVPFEGVWSLLVGGGELPEVEPPAYPRGGDPRRDLQAALAQFESPALLDLDEDEARDELARASATAIAFVAGGSGEGDTLAERFISAYRGVDDDGAAKALDAYWVAAAEHGMNASTFTARVVASTGADVGAALSAAVGALSGPLHGSAPARVLTMLEEARARR